MDEPTYHPDPVIEDICKEMDPAAADDLRRRMAYAQRLDEAGEMNGDFITYPETVPFNSDNPLIDIDDINTPTPSPEAAAEGPPLNEPNRTGKCGRSGNWRLPDDDEYIDDSNYIVPRSFWKPPTAKAKYRRLTALDNVASIRQELAKLYGDFHHRRIPETRFTKGAYALDCLARIARMETKSRF